MKEKKQTDKTQRTQAEDSEKQNISQDEKTNAESQAAEEEQLTEVQKLTALAEDYKRKWYSVSAEYDNFRKRNAQAVSRAHEDGKAETILKLLPVADTFGYAYDCASDEKTKAGIEKVIKNFNTILQSLGISEIEIKAGDKFDENTSSAVLNFPCEEGEEPNTIRQVLKKGYRSGDKVIRFAQVAVTI